MTFVAVLFGLQACDEGPGVVDRKVSEMRFFSQELGECGELGFDTSRWCAQSGSRLSSPQGTSR